jgi:hypothetical protein
MKTLAGPQSGAQGDIVASRNRSGQFPRQRVSPHNPRTAAQRRVRDNLRTFSRLWNQLWSRTASLSELRQRLRVLAVLTIDTFLQRPRGEPEWLKP